MQQKGTLTLITLMFPQWLSYLINCIILDAKMKKIRLKLFALGRLKA